MRTIGKLAEATGVKVPTIRYYEQIGLLPRTERSTGKALNPAGRGTPIFENLSVSGAPSRKLAGSWLVARRLKHLCGFHSARAAVQGAVP